jgi:methionine aminopeptidase
MFTVTVQAPSGKTRQQEVEKIREAGQVVAFALHYGADIDRKAATKLGMQAEKERTLSHAGYTFVIEKG